MFRRHAIEREYWGVCVGDVKPQTFQSLLIRDRGDGHRGSVSADADEKVRESAVEAITHVTGAKPLRSGKYTVVRCKLETGRTHQIRIHLAEAGHMLCGDKIYRLTACGEETVDRSNAPRHALHSDRLAFKHPVTGEPLNFRMDLPADLKQWLERLKTEEPNGKE